jgi:hypothetical protein
MTKMGRIVLLVALAANLSLAACSTPGDVEGPIDAKIGEIATPIAAVASSGDDRNSTHRWSDYQSLIQLGIGLNLVFGVFQAALGPIMTAGCERRREVLELLQADETLEVDAAKVAAANARLDDCDKFSGQFSRAGVYPSILSACLGILLLVMSSEYSESTISGFFRYAVYGVSLFWPAVTLTTLTATLALADVAVRGVRIRR